MEITAAGRKWELPRPGISLEAVAPYIALALLFVVGTFVSPYFLNDRNLLGISLQVAINGIVSIGQTFVILAGGVDLSVGSVLGLSSTLFAQTKDWGAFSLLITLAIAGLAGLVNGVLIIALRSRRSTIINAAFVVTLAALTAVRGTALVVSAGHRIENIWPGLRWVGQGKVGPVPMQAVLFIGLAAVGILVLQKTTFGRSVYALGANPTAARFAGVPNNRIVVAVFVISGCLAGFAGVVTASWLNVGDSAFHGQGAELNSIAAVAVGGGLLGGGKGTIWGTIAGVFIVGIMYNLMNLLQIPGDAQYVVKGLIIIGAVAIQKVRQ